MRELGLTPVWIRRGRPAAETASEPASEIPHPTQAAVAPESKQAARNNPIQPARSGRAAEIAAMDWPQLKASASACTACALHKQRKQAVIGVGDEKADWLFVGEGPGAEEDARGEPFVGQAGKLLDSMLAAIELKRGENVYIANVVKCRPPGNRNPEPGEAQACEPYLSRQIELIQPKLIVALGKIAAQNLLGSDATISSMRGKLHTYLGTPLIVTYHPAYLLRTLTDKARSWEDLCFAVETMKTLKQAATAPN
ncbi:MAG TPA: uracil-DNA glycosylase [Burkholderiales bacterium]|nr:uracil-DNA glycosylase [Burkholderiales bacterium]